MFFKNYNDDMSRMFYSKIKVLARETVLKVLLFQIFYKCRLLWSLEIQTDSRFRKIVNFDTNWIIPILLKLLLYPVTSFFKCRYFSDISIK